MSRNIRALGLVLAMMITLPAWAAEKTPEPWKGASSDTDGTLSFLTGMAIEGTHVDLAVLGAVAKRVVERGFVPDINDQVFLEVVLGPSRLLSTGTSWIYGVHLRWDFQYDDDLGLFAIGGLGGTIADTGPINTTTVHPRFGVGLLKSLSSSVKLRAEAHSEFAGAGLMFLF